MATVGAFKQAMKRQRELLESKGWETVGVGYASQGQFNIAGRYGADGYQSNEFISLNVMYKGVATYSSTEDWGFELSISGRRLDIASAQRFQSELVETVALVEELNKILTSECSDLIPGGVK